MSDQPYLQWRTARVVSAEDTLLTDYKPSAMTDAVKAKTFYVGGKPILLRAFGKADHSKTAELVFSGWMSHTAPKTCGPGHRLWRGLLTTGTKTFTDVPLNDGLWGASAAWYEVDTWDPTTDANDYDNVGAVRLDAGLAQGLANMESCLLLPTLGYTRILMEVRDIGGGGAEMTEVGVMYRLLPYEVIHYSSVAAITS